MMNVARNQFSLTREASIMTGGAARKQFLISSFERLDALAMLCQSVILMESLYA